MQLKQHLANNHLLDPNQSAYRQFHSTETAILKVHNDIMLALDSKRQTLLTLLDLSAAFDTIDHSILIKRMQKMVGISNTALEWFSSYLRSRTQAVRVEGTTSDKVPLQFGVPQGSVLGPILFTLYMLPLGPLIKSCGCEYHLYADDTQILTSFQEQAMDIACTKVVHCIQKVGEWMTLNKLKLNQEKTEALVTTPTSQTNKLTHLMVSGTEVSVSQKVRNLGAWFDIKMDLSDHVSKICAASHLALRKIGKVRRYLDEDTTERLVHAYITSRLDINNGILFGVPDSILSDLQRLQNTAARLICRASKYDHISPIFTKLHWLPVRQRISYKILLLCHKCQHSKGPSYLHDMLTPYNPPRNLRSTNKGLLLVPKTRTSRYGSRAFSVSAPTLWNNLPVDMRTTTSVECFKTKLKTLLCKDAYK